MSRGVEHLKVLKKQQAIGPGAHRDPLGQAGQQDADGGRGSQEKGVLEGKEKGQDDKGGTLQDETVRIGDLGLGPDEDMVGLALEVGIEAAADAEAAQEARLKEEQARRAPTDEGQEGLSVKQQEREGGTEGTGQDHDGSLGNIWLAS